MRRMWMVVCAVGCMQVVAQTAAPAQQSAPTPTTPAPAATPAAPAARPATPADPATQLAALQKRMQDWAQLGYYRDRNAALAPPAPGQQRVVFYGDSITEIWQRPANNFFPGKPYVDRGISGQTTAQMVVRFHQDVVDLHPAAVVILGGTNDVAQNTGPMTPEQTLDDFRAMLEMARANRITVLIGSIPPAADFPWRRGLEPAPKIRALNAQLKAWADSEHLVWIDYYSAMADADGGMKPGLSLDGVHPTPAGFAVMAPLAEAAIGQALAK